MKRYINSEGFSLIEIIVVIAIIGILSVLVVVGLKPQEIFANGRNSRRVEDVNALNSAIVQWLSREGLQESSPYSVLGVVGNGINAMDTSNGLSEDDGVDAVALNALITDGYLSKIPTDPQDGKLGYRIGVDDVSDPRSIIVCSGNIEITGTYKEENYPDGIFCLSN